MLRSCLLTKIADDPEMMDQVPCSVQLVGWTGQDEEVLMATEVVAEALSQPEKHARL